MNPSVPDRLRVLLEGRGLTWPAPIEHSETLGSTSDRLKDLARAGAPGWTVVLAEQQTAGRGRQGRSWLSPRGNVFLSVLLRPALPAHYLTLVPLAAGVAVCEALGEAGLEARLKWPNDLLVRGRKLAGVLAEASSGSGGLEAVVLGVGVNVGLDPRDLPLEIRESTTSISAETRREADTVAVAAAVLARLTLWYHALDREGPDRVLGEWRTRSVPWWGRTVEVLSGDRILRGVALGLDERGALLLEREDGVTVAVLSGEARELRLKGTGSGGTDL